MNWRFLITVSKIEFLTLIREKSYFFFAVLFPTVLYFLYTYRQGSQGSLTYLNYAVYCCTFAVFAVTFFRYGIGTSNTKNSTWGVLLNNLPLSPLLVAATQFFSCLFMCFLSASTVLLSSHIFHGTAFEFFSLIRIYFFLTLGAIIFSLLGFLIGNSFSKSNTLIVSNILYAGFSFFGGFWQKKDSMDQFIDFLPNVIWLNLLLNSQSAFSGQRIIGLVLWMLFFLVLSIVSSQYINFKKNEG